MGHLIYVVSVRQLEQTKVPRDQPSPEPPRSNNTLEVIRMYATILGKEGFRKGMDKYRPLLSIDFRASMADAIGADLDQFAVHRQYSRAPRRPTRHPAHSRRRGTA